MSPAPTRICGVIEAPAAGVPDDVPVLGETGVFEQLAASTAVKMTTIANLRKGMLLGAVYAQITSV